MAARLAREERRIAADPSHRSSGRTLSGLVTHNLIYDAPGSEPGAWDRFHVRHLGLAVNRRMRRESGGDASRHRERARKRVAAVLGASVGRFADLEAKAFDDLALVLDLVPDLSRWSREEKAAVVECAKAKAGRSERIYLARLAEPRRLRPALIALGSRAGG